MVADLGLQTPLPPLQTMFSLELGVIEDLVVSFRFVLQTDGCSDQLNTSQHSWKAHEPLVIFSWLTVLLQYLLQYFSRQVVLIMNSVAWLLHAGCQFVFADCRISVACVGWLFIFFFTLLVTNIPADYFTQIFFFFAMVVTNIPADYLACLKPAFCTYLTDLKREGGMFLGVVWIMNWSVHLAFAAGQCSFLCSPQIEARLCPSSQ